MSADTPEEAMLLTDFARSKPPGSRAAFCPAFDAVHRINIRVRLSELRLIDRFDDGRSVSDSIQKIVLDLAVIFLIVTRVMFVPIAIDRQCSLSKQWLDAVAVRHGEKRSVGKGYEH